MNPRYSGTFIAIIVVTGIFLSQPVWAKRAMEWRGSGGWEPGGAYGRMYNPATVETFSGEVADIQQFLPRGGMSPGVHLQLKTEEETIEVHLGPAWFIANQDVQIQMGDRLEVKGSRVTINDKTALIAAEIKKGDETLLLRDAKGFPAWSGWRRR